MKKTYIYLDDVRIPLDKDTWTIVRDYDEFVGTVTLIGLENIEAISLDHDLGDSAMSEYYYNAQPNYTIDYSNITERTGYDCCKWLVNHSIETGKPIPEVVIHSANPIGAGNMIGYINNYLKNSKLPQTCRQVEIPHTYEQPTTLTERLRKYARK
mgnify:CR=1 FL=1